MVINCKKPCKKKRSTMLTVEQMVDIALGAPEIGAVNFNILHALIHVIIQQLNIQKCLVEFKGYDSERMEGIILSAKPGPILKLSEYMIDLSGNKTCSSKDKTTKKKEEDEEPKEEDTQKDEPRREDSRKDDLRKDDSRKDDSKKDDSKKDGSKKPFEGRKKNLKNEENMMKEEKEKAEKEKPEKEKADKEKIEKEKVDKGKESDVEDSKYKTKKILSSEECEEMEEPEPKKVKKTSKPCPCKTGKEPEASGDESLKREPSSYYGSDSEGACQTIVRVEPVGEKPCDSWRSRPALAHESMVKLEEKVAMLQDAFEALEKMPTNEELKKRAQDGPCGSTPVKDLWQLYNLNKRVESCEGTIEKLASMIEDLVKETCNMREALLVIADAVDEIECADETGRNCCAALQGRSGGPPMPSAPAPPSRPAETPAVTFSEAESKPAEESAATNVQSQSTKPSKRTPYKQSPIPCQKQSASGSLASPTNPTNQMSPTSNLTNQTNPTNPTNPSNPTNPTHSTNPSNPTNPTHSTNPPEPEKPVPEQIPSEPKPPEPPASMEQLPTSTEEKPEKSAETPPGTESVPFASEQVNLMQSGVMGIGPEFNKMSSGEKFCLLKENVNCLIAQLKDITTNFPIKQIAGKLCALISMEKQLDTLEKEWREFCQSFSPTGISQLGSEIALMKSNIENLLNSVSKLTADKNEADIRMKNLDKDTDYLMRAKADLEFLQDQLAEKADASLVNRKVSHDQFDAACDDLTRGLDETLKRLMQQELLWNEAMDEIQKDLENKLDKNDIMPLKEFINKKLRCLQDKLKQLAQLRKDAEAAGAKSRILRNLNCISCDANVVMRMDNKTSIQSQGVHPGKNIKPLLSFQLDQVRKAMKKGISSRANLSTHVEEVVTESSKKFSGLPLTTRDAVENKISKLAHFCNRYCGGSHTITTPQQRVTRIGHFLTEFGPQAMALFNQEFMESKSNQDMLNTPGLTSQTSELRKQC